MPVELAAAGGHDTPSSPGLIRAVQTTVHSESALKSLEYRDKFGWTIEVNGGHLRLVLGNGMAGVLAPSALAGPAVTLLRSRDAGGPVLAIGSEERQWVMLCDPNGEVFAQRDMPAETKLLHCPVSLPLPRMSGGSARWVVAPRSDRRWLPSLAAVVAAVRETAAVATVATALPAVADRRHGTAVRTRMPRRADSATTCAGWPRRGRSPAW